MRLFLLTFFLLYGGMHLYAFLKVVSAFQTSLIPNLFVAVFMLVMIFAPVIVRLAERGGHEWLARFMAYWGYTWMAALFMFFCLSICLDLFRLCIYLSGLTLKTDVSHITSAHRHFFMLSLVWSLSAVLYGYFEARDIRIERISVETRKISKETGNLKIVQISDVHVGLIVAEERVKSIAAKVKRENPDILVSTGDLVDGQIDDIGLLGEFLKEIKPRLGKYAVTGNHEFIAGITEAADFTEKAGFRMLRGEGVTLPGLINIVGVDDEAGKTDGSYPDVSERSLLSGVDRGSFTLLLKHRPVVEKSSVGLFDLQLSGHTHKGQIFPFRYIVKLFFPTYSGYYTFPGNSRLYASRGTGTWGPPIRFLAPPEITVITLAHSDD